MPIYEFQCPICKHKFEELRTVGHFQAICPKCEKKGDIVQAKHLVSKFIPDFDGKVMKNGNK